MDLLLHNLRTIGTRHYDYSVAREAADEIERLRAALRIASAALDGMCAECRARFNVTTAPAGHGGACCGDCNGRCARTERDGKEAAA